MAILDLTYSIAIWKFGLGCHSISLVSALSKDKKASSSHS